jgi:potassium-dependent mechanosensitive channel
VIDLPSNWIQTGLAVLVGGILVSALLHWLGNSLDQGRYAWQRALRARLGVKPDQRIAELRWVTLSLQLTLWPVLGYVLLRLWGLDDMGRDFVDALLDKGFSIGGTTVVPGKVLMGLVAFLLLVTFTRWFKRKLERDWLPMTRMEPSVRMSVATLYGYVTFILAMLIGLSAAGLDLSKIALVAGALSVGIGFGLQNIVNNFVSGLILLFERPVRLGDYIKVGSTEGFVRQIRIRSTELENGDRISIIVPNSMLLSAEVENWNYRNSLGRITVTLGSAHGTDADAVRRLMLEVAQAHPQVIKDGEFVGVPGPAVLLKDIADTGLRFELGANIRDIQSKGGVASDLRFELLRRMEAEDLGIAFPQHEVWLRRAARDRDGDGAAAAEPPRPPQADEKRDLAGTG